MKKALIAAAVFFVIVATLPSQQPDPSTSDFATKVLPIFKESCYGCHSGNRPVGGLRLDIRSFAMRSITPGNGKESRLVHRLQGLDNEPSMPFGMAALSAEQIDAIKTWIDRGAQWPDALAGDEHWSYIKPAKPALPGVKDEKWGRNPIDRFVLARLEKDGLHPSPEATRETLIRRLSLDLIGLPPTPTEVEAFAKDSRPDAYDKLVDRLLASDRYGERWARMWLDLARYADSNGYEKDERRSMWPYRDWVINALNSNMRFDQFTVEQVAGDMLPKATQSQKIATGFLRNSMFNNEGGVDPEENNWNIQLDRTTTVSTTFLGATIGCAECHDHKFDPYTQKQFYQMVGFFNNAEFSKTSSTPFTEPTLDLPNADQAVKRDVLNEEIKQWQSKLNDNSEAAKESQRAWEKSILDAERDWQPLHPDRAESSGGSTLTVSPDGSVLASGTNPEADTYTIDATAPIGNITAIRLEALPDRSLPRGGPGRDYYGNLMIRQINIEGAMIKETAMDDSSGTGSQGPGKKFPQVWVVDVSKEENNQRLPRQMVMVLDKTASPGTLRITIQQATESGHQGIGRFRLSVTAAPTPKRVVEVTAALRPFLGTNQKPLPMAARYRNQAAALLPIRNAIKDLQAQITALGIPTTLVMSENSAHYHPGATIRVRGSFTSKAGDVQAAIPEFLGTLPKNGPQNRLALAKWLVSRDNPLTARVMVNHIWETYFGRGIVETSEDFGTQGSRPSHPELLDWLATEFMDSGWDMKALHRLIVSSATYRQSSKATPELLEKDPANILLSRGARFRVEAEMVRDITLAASGLLRSKLGGPSVFPYQPNGVWEFPYQKDADLWTMSEGEDRYRRGIYTFIRRAAPYPAATVFDATSREYCTARRNHTDTPLQALTTLNDPAFFEAAQAMAKRVLKEGGRSKIEYAFELVTSREPDPDELKTLKDALSLDEKYFKAHKKEAEAVSQKPDAELAAWTMLSRNLLNLDETLTRH